MNRITENLELSLAMLLKSKSFDCITIGELSDKAQIARRTFYLYYKDKNDFILSVINNHLINIKKEALKDRQTLLNLTDFPKISEISLYSSEAFFYVTTYVNEHRTILSSLMSKNSTYEFYDRLYQVMVGEFHERIELFNGRYIYDIPIEYIDQYYIGTIIGIFKIWLDMKKPEPVDNFLDRLGKFQINAPYEFLIPNI